MPALRQTPLLGQILLTVGILCGLLTAGGGIYFFTLRTIQQHFNQEVFHITGELQISNDISESMRLIQAKVFQHLLTQDPAGMRQLEQSIADLDQSASRRVHSYRDIADTVAEMRILSDFQNAFGQYRARDQLILTLSGAGQKKAATTIALTQLVPDFDRCQAVIERMRNNSDTEQNEIIANMARLLHRARVAADFLTGIAALIIIWTSFRTLGITRQLKKDNDCLKSEMDMRKRATEQLDRMVTLSPDMIFIAGFDGRLKQINSAFEEVLGHSGKELLAEPFLNFIHPDDAPSALAAMERCQSEGRFLGFEARYRCRNGAYKWLQINSVAVQREQLYYCVGRDINARKQAEEELERLRSEHRLILDAIGEGVHWIGLDGRIKFENPAAARMLGYDAAELIDLPAHSTMHHSRSNGSPYPQCECPIHATLHDGKARSVRNEVFWRKDGTPFPVEYACTPVQDDRGELAGTVVIFNDITQRKRLEGQLLQSQKMETVGKLAGGVAHEFNSILTAIIGHSELLLEDLPQSHPLSGNATEIRHAADRAADLTRQLLAYGRKQILQPQVVDLNKVLKSMESLIRHLMGPRIDVLILPDPHLQAVRVDAGQIEQVVMNMAINAGHAMPEGGKLTIETANIVIDKERAIDYPELKPGPYVVLAITDAGTGMSSDVRSRVFEPFFSTKEVGQGTGLGLATCYGIVKQSGGHITVYSEIDRGSTFKVYLPQAQPAMPSASPAIAAPSQKHGTESILLVEDDPTLREMAARLLTRLGYRVVSASDGPDALDIAKQNREGPFHLLFTDVVMPQMSGKELADRIESLHPGIKVLFTSAFTENAIVHQGVLNPGVSLLHKPYIPSELAAKIREILDGKNSGGALRRTATLVLKRDPKVFPSDTDMVEEQTSPNQTKIT